MPVNEHMFLVLFGKNPKGKLLYFIYIFIYIYVYTAISIYIYVSFMKNCQTIF